MESHKIHVPKTTRIGRTKENPKHLEKLLDTIEIEKKMIQNATSPHIKIHNF